MTGFIQSVIKNSRQLANLAKGSSTVTTVNQVLARTTGGVVIPATSTTVRSEVQGIANQSISSADAQTQVLAIMVDPQDSWVVDSTNNSNVAHNYQRMKLSNSLTVNNTGTDDPDGLVEQIGTFGDAADKKIIVRFI